jgi:hypothetical protein
MRLTEKKRIKIDTECKDYPKYLCWLNKFGGYDYWLFFKYHEEHTRTQAENPYVVNIDDLETANSTNDITGKKAVHSFRIGARVKEEDMDGLTGLYESPKVMLLMNPETWSTEGPVWQRVIVKTGSMLVLKTGTEFLEMKLEIQMPFINTQKE